MSKLAPKDRSRFPPYFADVYKSSIYRAPKQKLVTFDATPSEQTGPVFGHDELGPLYHDLIQNYATSGYPIGERLLIHGRVCDETGRGLAGSLIELWQANAGGRYRHQNDGYLAPIDPNFGGCGRTITDGQGNYHFMTIKPGPYPFPNGGASWRPAHIHFSVFGATFAERFVTQLYFEGDPMIDLCPIASTLPNASARSSLIARLDMSKAAPFDHLAYRFDIVLRGPCQTHFETLGS